jgi:hypothetical protein
MNNVAFTPGKLPDNEYAFKNAIFINPLDYKNYARSSKKNFVNVKNFILELLPLENIE